MHKNRTFRKHLLNFLQNSRLLAVVIFMNGVEFHGHFPLHFNPNTAYKYMGMLSLWMDLHIFIMLHKHTLLRIFIAIQAVKVTFCQNIYIYSERFLINRPYFFFFFFKTSKPENTEWSTSYKDFVFNSVEEAACCFNE